MYILHIAWKTSNFLGNDENEKISVLHLNMRRIIKKFKKFENVFIKSKL